MTNYTITVHPKVGDSFTMTYANAKAFSVAVSAYFASGIAISFDPAALVSVDTRLSYAANYVGD